MLAVALDFNSLSNVKIVSRMNAVPIIPQLVHHVPPTSRYDAL